MSNSPFQFDPKNMDPKLMMEMSQLLQDLSPQQLSKMQTLMHNMMAGFDVRKEMEEFEKNLPPNFRQKLMTIMAGQSSGFSEPIKEVQPEMISTESNEEKSGHMDLYEARMTILRAVAKGQIPPEEAEKLLFA